jgi:hypothetical protein
MIEVHTDTEKWYAAVKWRTMIVTHSRAFFIVLHITHTPGADIGAEIPLVFSELSLAVMEEP